MEALVRRSRETDNNTFEDSYVYSQYNSDPPVLQDTQNQLTSVDYEKFVGFDTPRFHERKRKGELIGITPYGHIITSGSSSGFNDITTGTPGNLTRWYSTPVWSPNAWAVTYEEVLAYAPVIYDEYVQEAAARIYGSGHDTLTFLAELTDVRHMFASTAKKLLKMNFPKNWKAMSSDWLSYRYGWRTLIYDLEDLSEAMSKLGGKARTRYSKRAGNQYSFTETDTWDQETYAATYTHVKTDKVTIGVRGVVVADIIVPQFQFNPLQTGWEVIPFSFVVDWFISVGKTLAAWSFLSFASDYTAAKSYYVTVERSYGYSITTYKSPYYSGDSYQNATCKYEYVLRTPCRIPVLPRLTLKLNSLKILDLIGLVLQRTR